MRSNLKKIAYQKPRVSRKKVVVNLAKKNYGQDVEMMLLAVQIC